MRKIENINAKPLIFGEIVINSLEKNIFNIKMLKNHVNKSGKNIT